MVRTESCVRRLNWFGLLGTEMTEMVPSGSDEKSSAGSPSLATTTYLPLGENFRPSGSEPTRTPPR